MQVDVLSYLVGALTGGALALLLLVVWPDVNRKKPNRVTWDKLNNFSFSSDFDLSYPYKLTFNGLDIVTILTAGAEKTAQKNKKKLINWLWNIEANKIYNVKITLRADISEIECNNPKDNG